MRGKPKRGLRFCARWRAINGYFRFGLSATAVVFALIGILAFGPDKVAGVPRWKAFWSASPNEIGDTIAGVAGALAFLWIIVTVMIQGRELGLQRKELELTRLELKLAREAQEKQLEVMQKQADIFEDEKKQRAWDRAKHLLDEMLDDLMAHLEQKSGLATIWQERSDGFSVQKLFIFSRRGVVTLDGLLLDEKFRSSSRYATENVKTVFDLSKKLRLLNRSRERDFYNSIVEKSTAVVKMKSQLPEDQKIRLGSIGIEMISESVNRLLGGDVWGATP